MANEISSIVNPCNTLNGKGLRRILLIEASSVLPRFFYAPTIPQPTLVSGKSWKEIQFIRKAGEFSESLKHDRNHGDFYSQTLSFSLKGDSVALTTFHNLLKNRQLAALITDQNGIIKFVPKLTPQSKLIKNERLNQYDIQMTFDSSHPAPVVEGSGEGTGGGGTVGTILKSSTPLRSQVRSGDLVDLERTDGGSFVDDGIPLGNFDFKLIILPSNTEVLNGGTNYGTMIRVGLNMMIPSPTVSLLISHRDPSPIFENFQYGTA